MSSSSDTAAATAWARARVLRGGVEAARVVVRPAGLDLDLGEPGVADPHVLIGRVDDAMAEGRAAGYADGYRDGLAGAAAEVAGQVDGERARLRAATVALERAAAELDARTSAALGDVEDAIVTAAFALATAIVGDAIEPLDRLHAGVRRALSLAPELDDRPFTVRVHPDAVAALGDVTLLAPGRSLTVVGDPGVAPGDCVVDGAQWSIDGRVTSAVERVREALGS